MSKVYILECWVNEKNAERLYKFNQGETIMKKPEEYPCKNCLLKNTCIVQCPPLLKWSVYKVLYLRKRIKKQTKIIDG